MSTVENDLTRHLADQEAADRYSDALSDFWTAERLDEHLADIVGAMGITASEIALYSIAEHCDFPNSATLTDSIRGRRLARAYRAAGLRMQTIYDQHADESRAEFRLSQRERA